MAGAVPKMVDVVNRSALLPIDAMFDGQPLVIPASYCIVEQDGKKLIVGAGPEGRVLSTSLPYFAAELAKRQNPVMGTEDPEAPNVFDSLLAVEEWGDDISPIEQSDAIERLDRSMMDDEAAGARPQRTRGSSRSKKGGRRFSNQRLKNPAGIKADYAD